MNLSTSTTRTASPCPADGTYHRDIGLPAGAAKQFAGTFWLELSRHAIHAAHEDRYGMPRLTRTIKIKEAEVVEVTFENSRATKATVRIPYANNPKLDIVLVIFPPTETLRGGYFIPEVLAKTIWLNKNDDTHKTLDKTKYQTPAPFTDVIQKMLDKINA